jgi:4-amino-4-deoxy-L-arabinose transferase-like glycosyltransferase
MLAPPRSRPPFPLPFLLPFPLLALTLAALVFAAIAPTLTTLEFSGGSENLIVGPVLEMRRGGPWIVPTLKGAPRTTKPPLATWLTAAAVRPQTVQDLSDPIHRERAYKTLAWQVRWPALLAGCILLLAAASLAKTLAGADNTVALTALIIAATSLLFQRYTRSATTDIQLAMWVTLTNALFAAAIFKRSPQEREPSGGGTPRSGECPGPRNAPAQTVLMIAASITLALALMTKGPVALVQTIVPLVAYASYKRTRLPWTRILLTTLIILAIALPWPLYVLTRLSGQLELWTRDATAGGLRNLPPDPIWSYLSATFLILPWLWFFILGAAKIIRDRARNDAGIFALLLTVSPVLVMTCFPQKNERYLLPMLAPAAIVAAIGFLHRDSANRRAWHLAMAATWTTLALIALGLPIAGCFLQTAAGEKWWSPTTAAITATLGAAILILAWRFDRDRELGVLPAALAIMLSAQALFIHGYSKTDSGLSDLKPLADAIAANLPPNTEVWGYTAPGRFDKVPIDLPIYLNRTVRLATHSTTLPTTSPQVIVVFTNDQTPLPPELKDWHLLKRVQRKKQGYWEAYARPD